MVVGRGALESARRVRSWSVEGIWGSRGGGNRVESRKTLAGCAAAMAVLCFVGIEVSFGLFGNLEEVFAFVLRRHNGAL